MTDETTEGLVSLGLPAELASHFEDGRVYIWPEHVEAVEVFMAMWSQWRIGMSGPTGLDYAALPAVFDLMAVAPGKRPERFSELQILEREALSVMAESRKD